MTTSPILLGGSTASGAATIRALLASMGIPAGTASPYPRSNATLNSGQATGTAIFSFFTPAEDILFDTITFCAGTTAASGITLTRFGFCTAATNDDVTLVARTASDTSLLGAAVTPSSKVLATTGGYPAEYTALAGVRYAAALLQVGTTPASLRGAGGPGTNDAVTPHLVMCKAGQTDLVSVTGLTADNKVQPWFRLSHS